MFQKDRVTRSPHSHFPTRPDWLLPDAEQFKAEAARMLENIRRNLPARQLTPALLRLTAQQCFVAYERTHRGCLRFLSDGRDIGAILRRHILDGVSPKHVEAVQDEGFTVTSNGLLFANGLRSGFAVVLRARANRAEQFALGHCGDQHLAGLFHSARILRMEGSSLSGFAIEEVVIAHADFSSTVIPKNVPVQVETGPAQLLSYRAAVDYLEQKLRRDYPLAQVAFAPYKPSETSHLVVDLSQRSWGTNTSRGRLAA